MFVDACAIIAVLAGEPEAERVSRALVAMTPRVTSPVAVLEAVMGLSRPDKFDMSPTEVASIILEFLDARDIEIGDLPPAADAVRLSAEAAERFGSGRRRLNLGDCLHYACARHYRMPMLATADEFRQTDLDTIP